MLSEYDPIKYWNLRLEPSSSDELYTIGQKVWLSKHLSPKDVVLDIGPGTGRLFTVYSKGQHVVGLDISVLYAKRAIESARSAGVKYSHIIHHEHSSVPEFLSQDLFSVVVLAEVLLHVPYESIERFLLQISRLAPKLLIITWEAERTPPRLAPHCFNHNYKDLFEKLDFDVIDEQAYYNQKFYAVLEKAR